MAQPPRMVKRSKEEIDALILQFQQDENSLAQTILVEHYTALVGSLVRKYSRGRNLS